LDERHIAKIGVENCAYSFDELFSFAIPPNLVTDVTPGRRVLVPFGKSNSVRQGFVFSVEKSAENDSENELKPVMEVLDNEPLLTDETVKLALFIRDRVFCTYFAAAKALLPGGMCSKAPVSELSVKMVRLSERAKLTSPSLTVKQQNIYDFLKEFETASVKELTYYIGCTPAVIKTMAKNGVCELYDLPVSRSPIRETKCGVIPLPELSPQQKEAYEKLYKAYLSESSETALLFGVTGSGKTNVYLSLIKMVIEDGKNVIVLVPEISLTSQTISHFERIFGNNIAVLHSGLSAGERRDEFYRIKHGKARIVIGTRSAVFAPVENLGAIIIDEEQEHTYKSEMSPRYDAKNAAKFRCLYNKALLVLASATPSVETFAKAQEGKYILCELTERYGNAVLPEVISVDMTDKSNIDRYSAICNPLVRELEFNLNNKKQSILLVNRRGYNTFVVCEECKNVVSCPKCSISLTYHSANNRLMCHYCGYSEEFTDVCPNFVSVSGTRESSEWTPTPQPQKTPTKRLFPLLPQANTTFSSALRWWQRGWTSRTSPLWG